MLGNSFAAFKGSENAKLMKMPGIKDRYGGVANQSRKVCNFIQADLEPTHFGFWCLLHGSISWYQSDLEGS